MLLEQVPVLPTPSLGSSYSSKAYNGTSAHGLGGPATLSQESLASAAHGSNITDIKSGKDNGGAAPATTSKKRQTDSKRKRLSLSATPTDGDQEMATTPTAQSAKEKKKKASRACCHCQKAHLTCDDSRPCQRCVKRGIADTCAEGHRKKAKYLLDEEELEALKKVKHANPVLDGTPLPQSTEQSQTSPEVPQGLSNEFMSSPLFPSSDPLFNLNFDHSYPFDSTAANMEYSMLSAILGNPSAQDDAMAVPPSPPPSTTMANLSMMSNSSWPSVPMDQSFGFTNGLGSSKSGSMSQSSNFYDASGQTPNSAMISPTSALQQFRINNEAIMTPLTPPASDPTPASPAMNAASPDLQSRLPGPSSTALSRSQRSALVYSNVNQPFDYVDGYHYLMQYLQGRFDKMDILRIVRALAIFRPSLIALQMDLSPEDEVFAEKCFQRTLIELEKLISFSGTPTVVWRRTGEICLVGVEFCMLTEYSQEDLVTKRKFIYELFEHQSVVEYWEKFASHAFESSSQSVNCHCVLLKPSGEPIPCAFCFSIKRDVFDLPNVVIGQWLPLL